jgi:hypothetical protein
VSKDNPHNSATLGLSRSTVNVKASSDSEHQKKGKKINHEMLQGVCF